MSTFVSTRGHAPAVSLREAVFAGLAPDGGLYTPVAIPRLSSGVIEELRGAPLLEVASVMARALMAHDIEPLALDRLLHEALDFDTPVIQVGSDVHALELFHGPTLAFKDVGARVLARLMAHFHAEREPLTVLTATSGDTGAAVAHAFYGLGGTRVVVLYPEGRVSRVQEAQFTTLGGNVVALAVDGTFDDCQRLAKEAFAFSEVADRVRLTSANSINVGRLLPQVFYYGYAALSFPADVPLTVSVPSGNFGNVTAGLIARRMGIPLAKLVAATTVNDAGARYLETGDYAPRPSQPTLANAMDVGAPSNIDRIRWLYAGRLDALQAAVRGSVHTDIEVRSAMQTLHAETGYVVDPHSAIAYLGVRSTPPPSRPLEPPHTRMFLATAHPAKFAEVVEPAINARVPLPAALQAALSRSPQSERIAPTLRALSEFLIA